MAVRTVSFGTRKRAFSSGLTDSSGAATLSLPNAQGGFTWRLLRMTIGAPQSVAVGTCSVYIGSSEPPQPTDLDSVSVDARGDTWSPAGGEDFVLDGEILTLSFAGLDAGTPVFAKVVYRIEREVQAPGSAGADPTIMDYGR